MNLLDKTFADKRNNLLNIYCTAGFPKMESTAEVMLALQSGGADMIELGMPYSDPIADGPVIQESNMQALANGMTIGRLFTQLDEVKDQVHIPVILMGYLNPVLQFGMEKFCAAAAAAGVSGVIIPDLPMYEFEHIYKPMFEKHGVHFIFLVTPETGGKRILKADALSRGFLYAVSSASTTGSNAGLESQVGYFKKLAGMSLANPILIGFGIKDAQSYQLAAAHAAGGIVGSAYINAIRASANITEDTAAFIRMIRGK
ncbi:MAG: tryptophan synthase, alpha chain [Ferruginibacter sp.]|nr:tryptophan synthase, alpha chain [Ferruginibacter sp.]